MTETGSAPGGLAIFVAFLLLVAPVYLLMRYFVGLVRMAYGFVPDEPGPVPRVCPKCHNTVTEDDFAHCPYCGQPLIDAESEVDAVADASDRPV